MIVDFDLHTLTKPELHDVLVNINFIIRGYKNGVSRPETNDEFKALSSIINLKPTIIELLKK
jgi:hypothetical protein